jgi:hypothetical protein
LRVCKFMINNLDDFCTDVNASHLLRSHQQHFINYTYY